MMCQRMGLPPISIIGFGLRSVSSLRREPKPPASMTAFTTPLSSHGRPRTQPPPIGDRERTSSYQMSADDEGRRYRFRPSETYSMYHARSVPSRRRLRQHED